MLPKIISNITLALIAIFVIYTFAPLIRDFFLSFLGTPQKKNYTKDEFEDLIRRKQERMGSTTVGSSQGQQASSVKSKRGEFDYLTENHFFASDEEKNYFIELKKELEWGAGKRITKIQTSISKNLSQEVDVDKIVKLVKETLTKNFLLEAFPMKGINIDKYISHLSFIVLTRAIADLQIIAKKLQCSLEELQQNIVLTIKKEQNQEWLASVEEYIVTGSADFSTINIVKIFEYDEFMSKLKKNIDIVAPLSFLDDKKLRQLYNEEDQDLLKKKHKRLLALYHPDKWTFAEKTDSIDKRLRENFDKIQTEYTLRTNKNG
ncbi:hypothetical protein [Bacteriovorax sp. Seq25_V]|uniref:hypothetical protein n=1 Tax=Bacteriovorax sp. Seq25_V TaxID=1201288 RepID=UPI000389EFD3|nr:hypothetical protein [Bacteriovorax sp. Seq25_V]EQC45644.1 hypothetical protein M900_1894 [Bacteriovorax sp. Seq25_V]